MLKPYAKVQRLSNIYNKKKLWLQQNLKDIRLRLPVNL